MNKIKLKAKNNTDITSILQNEILKNIDTDTKIIIPKGEYFISSTIKIGSNIVICGNSSLETKIILGDATNDHMFTNVDYKNGNYNISFDSLWIEGNAENQFKPEDEKRLSFCNFFYFKECVNINLSNIKAVNCKQTVMHFNSCLDVNITKLNASGMGWSGISSSGTDNIYATEIYIYDSGNETTHSAVHYDGGVGTYFSGEIEKCTGNGVMLDSKFCSFNKSIVKAICTDCMRGVSLSGDHTNELRNVLIKDSIIKKCDVGIMVSNSKNAFVDGCDICDCEQHGVLLQGKFGGCDTVVSDSHFKGNGKDISEHHSSDNNYFILNSEKIESRFISKEKNSRLEKLKVKHYADKYSGVCSVCGSVSEFVYYEKSVRESYRCQNCDASLRHRGQAKVIVDTYGNDKLNSIKDLSKDDGFRSLSIYEPGIIGPLRKYIKEFSNYNQSYYWDDIPFGDSKDGIQNQDLEKLTFDDNSFDLIITADIFEHICHPWKAFDEITRVLKPGGRHVFTIPVQYPLPEKTIYRVDTSSEEDVHVLPEVYHIAGDGSKSLVYTDFGADLLDSLNKNGLETVYLFVDETNELRKKNITFVSKKL